MKGLLSLIGFFTILFLVLSLCKWLAKPYKYIDSLKTVLIYVFGGIGFSSILYFLVIFLKYLSNTFRINGSTKLSLLLYALILFLVATIIFQRIKKQRINLMYEEEEEDDND